MRGVLALVGVAVLGFVPAGCGSDDDGAAAGTSSGGPAQTVDLTATEYAFDPSSLSVGAAGKVTFRISNDGQETHALEVEGKGIEEETDSIGAGESDTLTIDLQPGEYEFYCPVGGHRAAGMVGTLTVE